MKYKIRIKGIEDQAEGVKSFVLESTSSESLRPFTPGSHINIDLADGLSRSYSLIPVAGRPDLYAIAVRLDPVGGGGSLYLHETSRQGDVLTISEPDNNFRLHEEASRTCFIAGGIGITPFISMMEALNACGSAWELHYASRSRSSAPYLERLTRLAESSGNEIHLYFDDQPDLPLLNMAAVVESAAVGTHLYCCGPSGMLDQFVDLTSEIRDRAHLEYFSSNQQAATGHEFVVELRRSGKTIVVSAGETILEALLEAGVDVEFSCREGTCGTCEVIIIEGEADHRDMLLSDQEKAANTSLMVCCSGARSERLVLDL